MTQRKLTLLGAAFVGALLAASAGAEDRNKNSVMDAGDRGVTTPMEVGNEMIREPRFPSGQATMPRSGNTPMSPSESKSQARGEYQAPKAARGDNPNLPNPVTPQAANESSPNTLIDPTNQPGIPGGVGATR